MPTNVRQAILALFESAAYAETGLTDEIAIVESWASEVTEISLSTSTLTLNGDTPQTLVATTVPTGSAVVWSSSDSTIATVVGGVVTGVSNGTCTITASAGTKSATCSVTVTGFVELTSISAVYTQSGTVYDTDSLDSLKADLVVTATYSDSSTAVVTDYTLSGTLEVGTSTITVAYGGKTTTFSVTVTEYRGIPEVYTWLYDAREGELLSAQNYVTTASGGAGGSETLSNDLLVLATNPTASGSGATNFLRFNLTDTTTTNAKLSTKVRFDKISHMASTSTAGEGFRMQLSNGTAGAQVFFMNQPVGNTALGCAYFEGTTKHYVDLSAYDISTFHIVELELTSGKQILTIDGTKIFETSTLSSNYCTANGLLNQSGTASATPDGVQTSVDWLAYYEVA